MVVKKGNRELRSFTLVNVQKDNGCSSKFNENTRLVSSTPNSAAKKAFSRLCNLKRIKGKCTFVITVMDTTNNHPRKGKEYTYKVDRLKLKNPIVLQEGTDKEYKIRYTVKAKKTNEKKKPTGSCGKTSGPMKKTTPRKNKQEEKKKRNTLSKSRSKNKTKKNSRNLINRLRMN